MQLTLHADYSLRILLYLVENPERYVSTREISAAYGISRNHLVRVAQTLTQHGFLEVSEGRSGGLKLARNPEAINIGNVVQMTEPNFRLVECFDKESNTCPIVPACRLRHVLAEALAGFWAVLDGYTLADLSQRSGKNRISKLLNIEAPSRSGRS